MPLYLTNADLAPLLESDADIDEVISAIERVIVDQHDDQSGHVVFSGLPLEGEDQVLVNINSSPGRPLTVRLFAAGWNQSSVPRSSILLALDGRTGALEQVIEADELNRLRTAVPAAVGARHLARADAETLGVLGSSEQARGMLRTIIRALPGLRRFLVWSPTREHRERFADEQSGLLGIEVNALDDRDEVVRQSDVLAIAGRIPRGVPAFDATAARPGSVVISAAGTAPVELVASGGFYVPTTRRPRPVAVGFVGEKAPRPMTDPDGTRALADVIAGRRTSVRDDVDQVLVWELANSYLWDQAIASWVAAWAERVGAGTRVG